MTREESRAALDRSLDPYCQRKEFAPGEWATNTLYVADVHDGKVTLIANHGMARESVEQYGAAIRLQRSSNGR